MMRQFPGDQIAPDELLSIFSVQDMDRAIEMVSSQAEHQDPAPDDPRLDMKTLMNALSIQPPSMLRYTQASMNSTVRHPQLERVRFESRRSGAPTLIHSKKIGSLKTT